MMAGKKSGLGRGLDALFPEKTVQSCKTNKNSYTRNKEIQSARKQQWRENDEIIYDRAKQRTATQKI